jgi:phosphonate transport system substrate-binding protein
MIHRAVRTPSTVAALLVGLLCAAATQAESVRRVPPVRIGVIAAPGSTAPVERLEPFRRHLAEALVTEVGIDVRPDLAALVAGFAAGRIDLAAISAGAYAVAARSCGCVEPLVVARADDGTAAFHAVVVTTTASGLRVPTDLVGRRVATAGERSITGRRLATRLLARAVGGRGPDLETVDGPTAALAALLAGRAEAALVWSTLDGDPAEGYGRGTLHDAIARGETTMSDLRVVWASPELPHGPIVIRSDLPEKRKRLLRETFLALSADDPDAYEAIEPTFPGGFVRVGAAAYAVYGDLVAADDDAGSALTSNRPNR